MERCSIEQNKNIQLNEINSIDIQMNKSLEVKYKYNNKNSNFPLMEIQWKWSVNGNTVKMIC